MQDVDEVFPKPIKDFVRVVRDNFYEDLRSARESTAARMIGHDLDGLSRTRRDDTCAPGSVAPGSPGLIRGRLQRVRQTIIVRSVSKSPRPDRHWRILHGRLVQAPRRLPLLPLSTSNRRRCAAPRFPAPLRPELPDLRRAIARWREAIFAGSNSCSHSIIPWARRRIRDLAPTSPLQPPSRRSRSDAATAGAAELRNDWASASSAARRGEPRRKMSRT